MDMAAGPWETPNPHQQGQYPESLTAILPPEDEEYLAWLADLCWPEDEYFELEEEWREELEAGFPIDDTGHATCPGCLRRSVDVWPCGTCGRLLHTACGTGMRQRPVTRYRTRDMEGEEVVAEWICTNCESVVGLDTEPS
jgi:hypothetical protein